MKAHYCTNLVEGSRTIQGDVPIKDSTLNEVVRYHGSAEEGYCHHELLLGYEVYQMKGNL